MVELGTLQTMTDEEIGYLEAIRDELRRAEAVDPKLNAVRWFLSQQRSGGQTWSELGCIVFSQYYDTAYWVATELAKDFPDKVVAVYAGAGKSGLFRDGEFIGIERDQIKKLVKTREVQLVVATDAACEGLNLQTLGTLVNIDLPWNPSRLEQRLGRIKRCGQARDTVDMLNLTYHATRDEDVYNTISSRMKPPSTFSAACPTASTTTGSKTSRNSRTWRKPTCICVARSRTSSRKPGARRSAASKTGGRSARRCCHAATSSR